MIGKKSCLRDNRIMRVRDRGVDFPLKADSARNEERVGLGVWRAEMALIERAFSVMRRSDCKT
jgi:hypothetical protein